MATPGTSAADGRRRPRASASRCGWTNRALGELDRARPVDVVVDSTGQAGSRRDAAGTIAEVSRAVDGAHAFLVKIDLPTNPRARARACSGGRASPAARRQALTVPASAIVRRGQLTSVFVVDKDNRARLRLVQVASTSGGARGDCRRARRRRTGRRAAGAPRWWTVHRCGRPAGRGGCDGRRPGRRSAR